MKRMLILGLLLGGVAASPAWAQGTPEQRAACEADAYKWCPYDVPDVAAVEACLEKNIRWLTPACQDQFGYKTGKAKRRS